MAAGPLYGVLDPARDARIHAVLRALAPDASCLFDGPLDPAVERASPHVFAFAPGTPLARWWQGEGWGQSWGILLRSGAGPAVMRHHLRTLLRVQLPRGRIALFRFWDPRVLRVYLPTCDASTLRRVFGPVEGFYAEDPSGSSVIGYSLRAGGLHVADPVPVRDARPGR